MARTYNVISCDGHLEIPPDPCAFFGLDPKAELTGTPR
jgi:hypothetical protein